MCNGSKLKFGRMICRSIIRTWLVYLKVGSILVVAVHLVAHSVTQEKVGSWIKLWDEEDNNSSLFNSVVVYPAAE